MLRRFAGALIALLLISWASTAVAQKECRGTKKWYAGKCRYPKDIEALKKQQAANKAAEQKRREEEARRRAAEEKRRKEEAAAKDRAACDAARSADTVDAWKKYLKEHSGGSCLDEAISRITELSGAPPPPPDPQPVEPQPEPDPVAPPPPTPSPTPTPQPPPDDGGGSSISPLVWIGFGLGAVGLIVGSITGGVSFAQAQELQDECGEDNVCPSSRQDDVDEMLALAHTSTAMFVIAGVGTTLGIVGIFLSGGDDEQASLELQVAPTGLSLSGRF